MRKHFCRHLYSLVLSLWCRYHSFVKALSPKYWSSEVCKQFLEYQPRVVPNVVKFLTNIFFSRWRSPVPGAGTAFEYFFIQCGIWKVFIHAPINTEGRLTGWEFETKTWRLWEVMKCRCVQSCSNKNYDEAVFKNKHLHLKI